MPYESILVRDRYYLVNTEPENEFPLKRPLVPNLSNNELKIVSLGVDIKDCLIRQSCVYHRKPHTTTCKYFKGFTQRETEDPHKSIPERIKCEHPDCLRYLDVVRLAVDGCPANKESCVECEDLKTVSIPPWLPGYTTEKSHAYVLCGWVK